MPVLDLLAELDHHDLVVIQIFHHQLKILQRIIHSVGTEGVKRAQFDLVKLISWIALDGADSLAKAVHVVFGFRVGLYVDTNLVFRVFDSI